MDLVGAAQTQSDYPPYPSGVSGSLLLLINYFEILFCRLKLNLYICNGKQNTLK